MKRLFIWGVYESRVCITDALHVRGACCYLVFRRRFAIQGCLAGGRCLGKPTGRMRATGILQIDMFGNFLDINHRRLHSCWGQCWGHHLVGFKPLGMDVVDLRIQELGTEEDVSSSPQPLTRSSATLGIAQSLQHQGRCGLLPDGCCAAWPDPPRLQPTIL